MPFRKSDGISMLFAINPTIPITTIATKAKRQPNCCPRKVPKGTPVIVATVNPVNIIEIALALLSSGTKSAAIVEPMDIKTPCENAEMIRAIKSTVTLVAPAAIPLPIIKTIIIHSSKDLRGILEVSDVNTGAPIVTPSAYKETVSPAVVSDISKSFDISGNNPTLTNSVVPIANALTANASNAKLLLFYLKSLFLDLSFEFCINIVHETKTYCNSAGKCYYGS